MSVGVYITSHKVMYCRGWCWEISIWPSGGAVVSGCRVGCGGRLDRGWGRRMIQRERENQELAMALILGLRLARALSVCCRVEGRTVLAVLHSYGSVYIDSVWLYPHISRVGEYSGEWSSRSPGGTYRG